MYYIYLNNDDDDDDDEHLHMERVCISDDGFGSFVQIDFFLSCHLVVFVIFICL